MPDSAAVNGPAAVIARPFSLWFDRLIPLRMRRPVADLAAAAACRLREKSATKEATALLTPLLLGSDDGGAPTQADGSADSATASPLLRHAPLRGPLLSIVKLSGCGMALLKLADDRCMLHLPPPRAVVAAVTALLVAVASRTTPAPVHCQRIMPLQATCAATVHAVLQTAKRVAADFVAARLDDAAATASCSGDNSGPLRFAGELAGGQAGF